MKGLMSLASPAAGLLAGYLIAEHVSAAKKDLPVGGVRVATAIGVFLMWKARGFFRWFGMGLCLPDAIQLASGIAAPMLSGAKGTK